jgi:hypothetical protein
MSASGESMDQRRAHLAAAIARQRGELADAYRNLHKPIEIGESGLRAFGFIRQNSWIFVAVPAALKVITFFVGLRGGGKPPAPEPRQHQRLDRESARPKSFAGHALKWGGHGWKLFKIYRRVRHYFT